MKTADWFANAMLDPYVPKDQVFIMNPATAFPPPVISPNRLPLSSAGQAYNTFMKEVNNMDITTEFKKGYRTSEFWKSAIATLIPVFAFGAALFGYDVDTNVLLTSLGGLVPNVSYILGRTWLKRKRIDGATVS